MVMDVLENLPAAGTETPAKFSDSALKLRGEAHKTAAMVAEDIEKFHMNKAVARVRELSNTISSFEANDEPDFWALKEAIEILVCCLSPITPHLAEELWAALGHETILAETRWPKSDPSLMEDDSVTIGVQVNGKVRATITLPKDADKSFAEETALANDDIQRHIDGKTVRKVIVVPNRIVNVVVG